MPFTDVCEAIHRVRRAAQGKGIYINPHTLVEFSDWNPLTTSSIESLIPAKNTQQFKAYKAAMEIYRMITIQPELAMMELNMISLQPCLADFKNNSSNRPRAYRGSRKSIGDNVRRTRVPSRVSGQCGPANVGGRLLTRIIIIRVGCKDLSFHIRLGTKLHARLNQVDRMLRGSRWTPSSIRAFV